MRLGDRTSVREVGVGKSVIAFVCFLHGRTVSLVISKPANSTVSIANLNFLGLSVMPCRPQMSSHSWACRKLSAIVVDHRRVSSIHFVFEVRVRRSRRNGGCIRRPRRCSPEGQSCNGIYPMAL